MEKQNVTLSLPKLLLKKAKLLAVSQNKSLSELIRESLEEKVREKAVYNKAKKRQLGLMEKGIDLGTKGKITISRDELHVRR